MVWNALKQHVYQKTPKTEDQLAEVIGKFWTETVTPEYCTRYIEHLYKVVPVCVKTNGRATGSVPKKLFPREAYPSSGKCISYFNDLLQNAEIKQKAEDIIQSLDRDQTSHVDN